MNLNTINLKYLIHFITLLIFSTVFGQEFKEIKIGNQIWMSENLNVDKFKNGVSILEAKSFKEWDAYSKAGEPVWCYYDFNNENYRYGKLYNVFAVINSRGLAPEGWDIPNRSDFQILLDFLGGQENEDKKNNIASTKLRSDFDWYQGNNGTNIVGFSALPCGRLSGVGFFLGKDEAVEFWSNDNYNIDKNTYYTLKLTINNGDNPYWDHYSGIGQEANYSDSNFGGLYVRCLKSSTSSSSKKNALADHQGNDSQMAIDYYDSGRNKANSDDYQGALIDYNKAKQLGIIDSKLYLGIGFAEFQLNNFSGAITNLSKSIELEPNKEAYLARAWAYHSIKMYDNEIEDWSKVIELNDVKPFFDLSTSYCCRGDAYFFLNNFSDAVNDYSKALELNPNNSLAKNNLELAKGKLKTDNEYFNSGADKFNSKDYNGAILDYSNAIQLNPNNSEAYLYRGVSKYGLKDFSGSLEDINKSIQINSNHSEAYYNRGVTKYYLNDFNGTIEDFSKAILLNPNYSEAYYLRARTKLVTGDYNGAIEDFSVTIQLDPSNSWASYGKEKLEKILYQSKLDENQKSVVSSPKTSPTKSVVYVQKNKPTKPKKIPTTRKCECCGIVFKIENGWGYYESLGDVKFFHFGEPDELAHDIMNVSIATAVGYDLEYHSYIKYHSKRCAYDCGH